VILKKNYQKNIKNYPNGKIQVSVASVPKVILVMNRNYIIDIKHKNNEEIIFF